jgi:hypothetical protein
MKKTLLLLLVAVLVAFGLRLYPTILSGEPYSTDAWAPIRNAELLAIHTPVALDSSIFDQYNNYWPANSLFGVVFGQVTGLPTFDAMALGVPLVGALAVVLFFALVYVVTKSSVAASFASLILATIYPYAVFVSGVTKETYASPIFVLCLFLFCLRRDGGKWGIALLFGVASVGLVLSHHLTDVVALVTLAVVAVGIQVSRVKRGLGFDKFSFVLVSILAAATVLYFVFFAYAGMSYALTVSDYLSAASYLVIAFAVALFFVLRVYKPSRLGTALTCAAVAAVTVLFVLLSLNRSIVAGVPALPANYLLYAVPFFVSLPLAFLGIEKLLNTKDKQGEVPLFWLGTILALCGFTVFAGSVWSILFFRLLNFLCLPLALFCAVGCFVFWSWAGRRRVRRFMRATAAALMVLVVGFGAFNAYASVSLQERYLQYYWLYTVPEFDAAAWTAEAVSGTNLTVSGDVKTCLLLQDYFCVKDDSMAGLKYLTDEADSAPQVLIVYDQMSKNGYVFHAGYGVDLPENWTGRANELNLVYSNGGVRVNCR